MSRPISSATRSGDAGGTLATIDEVGGAAPARPTGFDERPSGSKLGRYTLLEPVGRGGMGIVYAAYDPQLDRRIALKVLRPRQGRPPRPRDRARLEREAQAMARLSHPNVIAVHDVAESDGELFLAMEFVEGDTLKRWLDRGPRSWVEIVEVFLAAGQGLAAAHEAGLIHRDFKPDNVLIGIDGRVRVTDFGLARAGDAALPSEPAPGVEPGASTSVAQRITHAGALLGTPAYMSPEQHGRLDLDARTDQFSFCVALYEALFATHPFDGETVAELAASVTVGRVREPPKDHAVPAKIRRAILQGLQRRPADRWPSMEPLLDALRVDPRQRRRTLWLASGGVAIALVAGGAVYAATRAQTMPAAVVVDACGQAGAGVDLVWSPDRAETIEARFVSTGRPAADRSWARAAAVVDAWADTWRAESKAACEATRVQGVQSDEMLDLRSACLSRRLDDLDAALAVFEDADGDLVADATEVATRLIPVSVCADTERLRDADRLPDDPTLHARAQTLQREISELRALYNADRFEQSIERAERLVDDAIALDFGPILAESRRRLALAYAGVGRFDEAHLQLRIAAEDAALAKDDAALAAVLLDDLDLMARLESRYDDALVIEPAVRAAVYRAGRSLEQEVQLNVRRGSALLGLGRFDDSRAAYERARELAESSPDMLASKAAIYNNLGAVEFSRGRFLESRELFRRALDVRRKFQGDLHVEVAEGWFNVGNTYLSVGDPETGIEHLDKALTILAQITTPPSRAEAGVRSSLSVAYFSLGRFEEAKREARLAVEAYETLLGAHSPARAGPLVILAQIANLEGDENLAATMMEQLQQDLEQELGDSHPHVGVALGMRGRADLQRGDLEGARVKLERSLAMFEPLGPDHPWRMAADTDLALVAFARGDLEEGRRRIDEALRLAEAGHEDRQELVRTWHTAARIYGDTDPTRAHRWAERALVLLRDNGGRPAATLADLERLTATPTH